MQEQEFPGLTFDSGLEESGGQSSEEIENSGETRRDGIDLPSVSAIKQIQDMIDRDQSKVDLLVRSLNRLGQYFSTGLNSDSQEEFHDEGSSKADRSSNVDQSGEKRCGKKLSKPFKKYKEVSDSDESGSSSDSDDSSKSSKSSSSNSSNCFST